MGGPVHGAASTAVAITTAYALGCLSAGYYLVRLRTGRDVRAGGSGATGATNVGRVLGARGFASTLALDAAKGVMAVWVARQIGAGAPAVAACVPAVVAGHLWPAQLRFRGGKGVAPSLGAVALYDWRIALVLLAAFGVIIIVVRRLVPAGLLAYAATPIVLACSGSPVLDVAALAGVALLVWMGHRSNLAREAAGLAGRRAARRVESSTEGAA